MNLSEPVMSTIPTTSTEGVTARLLETQPHLTTFMLVLYGIIFVVGLTGNLFVVYVVIKDKAMHTTTNKFIACLSVSDLLICIFAIPFTPINALGKSWSYGELLCKLVPVILVISVFVSTLTSVMIAVDRYIVIIYPHSPSINSKIQIVIVICIWVISAATAVPIGMYTALEQRQDGTFDCHERWPNQSSVEMYTWVIFGLQVVIPAIIISVCYGAIGIKLRKQTKKRFAHSTTSSSYLAKKEHAETLRNRRINRMLISMVVIFIMCWLPLDLIHVAGQYLTSQQFLTAFLFCHIIAMSSVMYNPILYAWLNDNFNKHFREICHKAISCCKKKLQSSTTSSSDQDDFKSSQTRNFNLSIADDGCNHTAPLEAKGSLELEDKCTVLEESRPMLGESDKASD